MAGRHRGAAHGAAAGNNAPSAGTRLEKDSMGEMTVPADVLYGDRSAVWDQAENRLHAQKALLEYLLGT